MRIPWKRDPEDPDGYVANIGDVRLAANIYGWRAWVLDALARDVLLTDETIRRDARAHEGRARRPLTITMESAERFATEIILRAEET